MTHAFGPDWQRDLWASPFRLRFELNEGTASHLSMFTASYDRARALARAVLPADQVIAVIAANPKPKTVFGAKWRGWGKRTALELLEDMGVPTGDALASWEGYFWPDDEADDEMRPWTHRAVRVSWEQADILLWNQVAQDLGVLPQAPVMSKFLDPEQGILVHAYDDRGMDVSAMDRETLSPLYRRFDGWLLDYDRPRMSAAFDAASA